tara:strand:+ start:1743 stop:2012 length:270 start_codon:yes stop_codon:yes gene_type:complete
MFNIGWQEILIISIVIILILGPKELPGALNTFLGLIRKIRGLSAEFLTEAENMISREDLSKVKESMENIKFDDELSVKVNKTANKKNKK